MINLFHNHCLHLGSPLKQSLKQRLACKSLLREMIPKGECRAEKSGTGKEGKGIQGCIVRGSARGHLGLDPVEDSLRSCWIFFKLCTKWPKRGMGLCTGFHTTYCRRFPIVWVLTLLHSQVCKGTLQNETEGLEASLQVICRMRQRNLEQKVRGLWGGLGEVISVSTYTLLGTTAGWTRSWEHQIQDTRGAWHSYNAIATAN